MTKTVKSKSFVICNVCHKREDYHVSGTYYGHNFIVLSVKPKTASKRLYMDFCSYECAMLSLCGALAEPPIFGLMYRIVLELKRNKLVTHAQLAKKNNVSIRTITRAIESIRAMGTVKIVGGPRGVKFQNNHD